MQKYSAALIAIGITLAAAIGQITGTASIADGVQLVLLAANAVLIYLVPLLGDQARSTAKTSIAVFVALLTAGTPFIIDGHITGPQIAVVALAGLQALGAHVGVQLRKQDLAAAA